MNRGNLLLAALMMMMSGIAVGATAHAQERDPLVPRVPADQIVAAKAWKNPYEATPQNIAKGKALYEQKGSCAVCHGKEGRGNGPAGHALIPLPRNFHNPQFFQVKTPGEIMWVIKHGSPGTGMISYVPVIISEDEAALIILYISRFGDQP